MSALFFLSSFVLAIIAIVRLIRASRKLEGEGRRLGYDFFSLDYSLGLFRPEKLPPSLRPHVKKMWRVGLAFLLPAVALMLVGFWLEGFYLV